jgi:streptomycin 6-kinase
MELPSELVKHVSEGLGDVGRQWLVDVPGFVRHLEAAWKVSVGEPIPTGEFNFVAPATGANGESFIIKIAPPYVDGECYAEAAFLRHHDGKGCVRLLKQDRDARAMLLERAVPGLNLSEEFAGCEMDAVAPSIAVLMEIHAPPPVDGVEIISLDKWFSNLERARGSRFPGEYAEKALDIYARLSARGPKTYLHGDFHPGNIVTATRQPYLAIDPKGIVGHVGYDIAVFLTNLHWWQQDKPDIKERLRVAVRQFSEAFGIPEIELRQWAYASQVLGAWWTFDEMRALYSGGVVKADIWDV